MQFIQFVSIEIASLIDKPLRFIEEFKEELPG